MQTVTIDLLDGRGEVQVAVDGFVNARRLETFAAWAKAVAANLADAEQRIAELENQNGN